MSLLDPHMLLHLVVRALDLAAMVIVVGGLAFDAFVMTPVLGRLDLSPSERAPVDAAYRARYTRLVGWALAVLVIIQFADLLLRVQMMSGKPFSVVMGLLPSAITGTHIGKVWIAKIGALTILAIVWLVTYRRSAAPSGGSWNRPGLLAIAAIVSIMVALAGHAADQGNVSPDVAADWLHVLSICTWVGGLVAFMVLVPTASRVAGERHAARLFTRAMARFSTVAGWSLGALLLTGAYGVWLHIHSWAGLAGAYGTALLVKLAFVAPMIGLGALGRFDNLPELQTMTGEAFRSTWLARVAAASFATIRRLSGVDPLRATHETIAAVRSRSLRFIVWECVFAVGVLAGTSVLTQTMPPHVTDFAVPEASPHHMMDMPNGSMP
ncbi:MAG TPA: CopD family protein [Nitrospiria bacterium]|nr:CopD family protein [Nitrospiria bacterium]